MRSQIQIYMSGRKGEGTNGDFLLPGLRASTGMVLTGVSFKDLSVAGVALTGLIKDDCDILGMEETMERLMIERERTRIVSFVPLFGI
jgi:hypothetical protein